MAMDESAEGKPGAASRTPVEELFRIANATPDPQSEPAATLGGELRARAAVLGAFAPSELLSGLGDSSEAGAALESVLQQSVMVTRGNTRRWLLQPRARLEILERLGTRAVEVLDAVKSSGSDGMSAAMAALIREQAPEPASVPTELLRSLVTAGEWMSKSSKFAADALPQWKSELKRRELLEPIRNVIGKRFVGREKELKTLRGFVDIAPPGDRFEGWARWVSNLRIGASAPLMLTGIGGAGKSTLMAQFILQHAVLTGEREFPFVYLDFDRPSLDPSNPATLLVEALTQLETQFPKVRPWCESLRMQIREDMQRSRVELRARSRITASGPQVSDQGFVARATASFLSFLQSAQLADRPFLLVLDTFEVVQIRGQQAVDAVFDWLAQMNGLRSMRAVIAGRAPVEDRDIAKTIALGDIDRASAIAFLTAEGMPPAVAREVHGKVGGNPLCLKLALKLADQKKLSSIKAEDLKTGFFGKSLDAIQIQGYLYTRLLAHITDKKVLKLAHPGLVLRRITPQLILQVLAPVVGLQISTLAEATTLYDALRREVSLVTEEGGALVHRKDVRGVMLKMQREDQPELYAKIHARAAEYYRGLSPEPSSVEFLELRYHELMQEGDAFALLRATPVDVIAALAPAIDELPPLASDALRVLLGHSVARKVLKALPDDFWASHAYQRANALITAGAPEAALKLIGERRTSWSDSLLAYPKALALFQVLKWSEADQAMAGVRAEAARGLPRMVASFPDEEELAIRPSIERGYVQWYRFLDKDAMQIFARALQRSMETGHFMHRMEAQLGVFVVASQATGGSKSGDAAIEDFHRDTITIGADAWRSNLPALRRVLFLGYAEARLAFIALDLLGLRLRTSADIAEFLRRFGAIVTGEFGALAAEAGELSGRGEHASSEGRLRRNNAFAALERRAQSELLKSSPEVLQLKAVGFIRGQFAPWKVPARNAVLALYPERKDLEAVIANAYPGFWSDDAVKQARDGQALVDALVDYADEENSLLRVLETLARHAQRKDETFTLVMRAVARYARQLARYPDARNDGR